MHSLNAPSHARTVIIRVMTDTVAITIADFGYAHVRRHRHSGLSRWCLLYLSDPIVTSSTSPSLIKLRIVECWPSHSANSWMPSRAQGITWSSFWARKVRAGSMRVSVLGESLTCTSYFFFAQQIAELETHNSALNRRIEIFEQVEYIASLPRLPSPPKYS